MAGTPVKTGAICGTFVANEYVCGAQGWTVPFTAVPFLDLGGGVFIIFTTPPVVATIGRPFLDLVPQPFLVTLSSTPQFNTAILLLEAVHTESLAMIYATMGMPELLLQAVAFLPAVSQTPPIKMPFLDLVGGVTRGRIAGLIPTDPVTVILVPTVPSDGSGLLVPTVEGSALLTPTLEAVG